MALNQGYNGAFIGEKGSYFVGKAKNKTSQILDNVDKVFFPGQGGHRFDDDSMNPVTGREGITGREGNTPIDPGSKI